MWKTVKLGDVCTIKTGKKDVNEGNPTGAYPFFTCAKEHTFSDVYSFDCEAILIAGNGAVGQTTYYEGKFEAYQRTYVLTDFHSIHPKLLLFILQGKLMQHLSSMVLGNTIPYIKKGMLQNFEFPLPPLAEQQRIVAKLDAAFAKIDRAVEAANQSIESTLSLRESTFAAVTERNGSDTITQTLGELLKLSSGKFLPKKKMNTDGSINVIGGNGLAGNHDEANLFGKNVVIGRVGAKCGNVHFFDENIWVTDNAMYAHSFSFEFDKEFLALALASLNLGAYARQAAQPVISFSSIKDASLTFPPSVSDQREIVSKYNNIQVLTDSLTVMRSKKQIELNCLKSALLTQELQPPQSDAA